MPRHRPEARDVVLPGVAGGRDLALDAPLAEAAGDHDAVEVPQPAVGQQALDVLGLDPLDLDLGAVVEAGVAERLDDRQVGVGQADVLADDADADRVVGRTRPGRRGSPTRSGRARRRRAEDLAHDLVEALLVEHERDLVEVAGVGRVDDRLDGHVAQVRDLALQPVARWAPRCGRRWRRAGCRGCAAR